MVKALCSRDGATARFISCFHDKKLDLAVFKLDSNYTNCYFKDFNFVTEKNIEYNYVDFFSNKNNTAFALVIQGDGISMDHGIGKGVLTQVPLCTFYTGYEFDLIKFNISTHGFGEDNKISKIRHIDEIGGSWVYCYNENDEKVPFKCVGLLCRGENETGRMWALGIDKITEFIDSHF